VSRTSPSRDEARETHCRGTRGNHGHGRGERHAGQGLFHDAAQIEGTNVLAHVYLLEVVSDPMGHMMAGGGRQICQPDDTGGRRRSLQ